ncbi:MAG: hypothetical protein Q8P45_03330 [Candidatus Harrisonbacteria bacterium]|nr:hypothetical protein [Candidatus Harrisonbacteria bacterium]
MGKLKVARSLKERAKEFCPSFKPPLQELIEKKARKEKASQRRSDK